MPTLTHKPYRAAMTNKTITRADLVGALQKESGLSQTDCTDLLEGVLNEISNVLITGEAVKISSFASFSVRQKKSRMGRNPKTGEEAPITPRTVIVFRASRVLKGKIKGTLD